MTQDLPQPPPDSLRCCLLSGGKSRRMGRDKALLSHPRGGTWLEAALLLLAELGVPVSLLSGHSEHMEMAARLAPRLSVPLTAIQEPLPHQGPLLALGRLMDRYPGGLLLLCPVDMPGLERDCLLRLVEVALASPASIHVAHDGVRCQPLLGIYPARADHHHSLRSTLRSGERALHGWLERQGCNHVPLPAAALRNVNVPEELDAPQPPASRLGEQA